MTARGANRAAFVDMRTCIIPVSRARRALRSTTARVIGMAALAWPAAGVAQAVRLPSPDVKYVEGHGGKVTGLILNREGDDLLVRDETTSRLSVVSITPKTDIGSPTGFLNLERKDQPPTTLIPGLIIVVKGTGGPRGNLVADRITFRKSALRVATQIAAGEVVLKARERQTAAIAEANRDSIARAKVRARDSLDAVNARVSELDKYDLRVRGTVYFAEASAELSNEARMILDDLFEKSRGLAGYRIEIVGYSNGNGTAERNQTLSERRAQSVVAYLTSAHGVPPRRIATPVGVGATRTASSDDTPEGRAKNRRVDVRVLVSRGLRPPPDP
jgi:outer membrane protein OmpA-like peptidoglycan-associated protein